MIDTTNFPLDEQVNQSYAAWAGKPRGIPGFFSRRLTGAIIRSQSSLGRLVMFVFAATAIGLLLIAAFGALDLVR